MRRTLSFAIAAVLFGHAALAQDVTRDGRYALVPVDDGFLRLDTETGEVSRCMESAAESACRLLPDERLAYEAEIRRLEERMDVLEGRMTNLEVPPDRRSDGRAGEADGLTGDPEIDRALDVSEEVVRRFFGFVRELRRDLNEGRL